LTSSPLEVSRNGKHRGKRRVTIDCLPRSSPPASSHASRPMGKGDKPLLQDCQVNSEDQLPPRMRKRLAPKMFEDTQSLDSSGSGSGLGPAKINNGVGLGIRIASEGSGDEASGHMEVDHDDCAHLLAKEDSDADPASTNIGTLTTISSGITGRSLNTPTDRLPPLTSPSTSFAQLSLRSPIFDYHGAPRSGAEAASMDVDGEREDVVGATSCDVTVNLASTTSRSFPLSPQFSPTPSDSANLAQPLPVQPPHDLEAPTSSQPFPTTQDEEPDVSVASTQTTLSPSVWTSMPLPSSSVFAQRPPSPPPPLPKVKMSLKDFAMRKKKMREEEMAKSILSSPASTSSAQVASMASEPPSPQTNGGADKDRSDARITVSEGGEALPYIRSLQIGAPLSPESQSTSLEATYFPTQSPNGTHGHKMRTYPALESLQAKLEFIEAMLPRGVVAPDDRELGMPPEPPPPPLNGDNRRDGFVKAPFVAAPIANPYFRFHSRRPSREDGEITSASPPKPRSQFSSAPRSHTPPTQPRSFQAVSPTMHSGSTPPSHGQGRYLYHPSLPAPTPAHRGQSLAQQQQANFPARPPPRGPRALQGSVSTNRPSGGGPPFLPRGPSADRDRMDWERERGWLPRARGRGGGNEASWGR
jgi:hypothetical protein